MRSPWATNQSAPFSTRKMLLILLLAVGLSSQTSKAQSEETTDTNQTDNDTADEIVQMTRMHPAVGAGQVSTESPRAQDTADSTGRVGVESSTPATSGPLTNLVVSSTGTTQTPIIIETSTEFPETENIENAIASILTQQSTNRPRPVGATLGHGRVGGEDTDMEDSQSLHFAALASLNNISSLDDLLATRLVVKNGHVATRADYGAQVDSNGKMYISGPETRAEMPESDECGPRPATVRLNITNVDATILVYPRCIQELRCGGCCRVPNVACVSIYNETKLYNLLQLRPFSRRNSVHLESVGFLTLRVERHLRCQCRCTLTRQSCGPLKLLKYNQCRCECRNRPRCRSPSTFNEETCGCECPQHLKDSCEGRLDPTTCNCGRNYISAGNSGNQQVEGNLTETNTITTPGAVIPIHSNTPSRPAQTTPAPITPNPATASTAGTSRVLANPCASLRCPVSHEPFMNNSRTCSCRPRNRGPIRRRPGGRGGRTRGRVRPGSRFGQRPMGSYQ